MSVADDVHDAGEDVLIMRSSRKTGSAAGVFTVPDDFDAPLPDEFWQRLNL